MRVGADTQIGPHCVVRSNTTLGERNRVYQFCSIGEDPQDKKYADEPTRLICEILPDILVKGGDNDPDKIPGGDCVRENGGEVRVLSYVDGVSTTEIIGTIRDRSKE